MYATEHSGTHIDALCHQAEDLHLYGGREVNASMQTLHGFTELGVETIAPLITRGVLLDIARHRGVDRIKARNSIKRDDLEAYEFTFICLPLKLRGATGSPVRPVAIA